MAKKEADIDDAIKAYIILRLKKSEEKQKLKLERFRLKMIADRESEFHRMLELAIQEEMDGKLSAELQAKMDYCLNGMDAIYQDITKIYNGLDVAVKAYRKYDAADLQEILEKIQEIKRVLKC